MQPLKGIQDVVDRDVSERPFSKPIGHGMRQDRTPIPPLLCELSLNECLRRPM